MPSVVHRESMRVWLVALSGKTGTETARLLKTVKNCLCTITVDNGKERAGCA